EVLDRVGDAVEGPDEASLHLAAFRRAGPLAGVVGRHGQVGVELGVEPLDPGEDGVGHLDGRDLPRADQTAELDGGRVAEVGWIHGSLPIVVVGPWAPDSRPAGGRLRRPRGRPGRRAGPGTM